MSSLIPEFNKVNHFNNGLYASGNPLYFVVKNELRESPSNITHVGIQLKIVANRIKRYTQFTFANTTYKGVDVITNKNQYLLDYSHINQYFIDNPNEFQYIYLYPYDYKFGGLPLDPICKQFYDMFSENYKNNGYFETSIRAYKNYNQIESIDLYMDGIEDYENISSIKFEYPNTTKTITDNIPIYYTEDFYLNEPPVVQDVDLELFYFQNGAHPFSTPSELLTNYEIQCKIYNKNKLITTLAKKGFDLADFDISQIVDNSITKYKPLINNFNINTIKYIEKFKLEAYQKFVDKSIDPNNNFSTIQGSSITSNFYAIKSKTDLFENYNSVKYDNIINQGTSGYTLEELYPIQNAQVNLEGDDYNLSYYTKLLTKQSDYKALNKSYEILCWQVYSIDSYDSTLNDVVAFKFYYDDGTNQSVTLNNLNLHSGESYRYINQLSFKVDYLKTLTSQDWSEVNKIQVRIENYTYQIGRDLNDSDTETDLINESILYDFQTYYIDRTNETCNDNLSSNEIDYTPIVFLNSLGGFDLFEFGEIQEFKSNRKIESYTSPYTFQSNKLDDFEKIYDMSYNSSYLIKSRTLSKEEFKWLKDLVQSKEVYILKGTDLIPIIVNDISYEYKINDDKGINLSFNYSRPENI